MPPPPAGLPGIGGGRSTSDCSASDHDHSPQPGPLGLGSGSRSETGADRSRSEYGGCSSPTPSGAAEDDCSSTFDSVDLDRDDSFRAVLRLIREFHSMEELAGVTLNRCKRSILLHWFTAYNLSFHRLFTCLFPPCCGLSLRTRTWLCPSLWKI